MTDSSRSMPDIAEELMREFEDLVAVSTVTEVVLRLSRTAQVSLAALADLAREELRALAPGIGLPTASLPDAVASGSEA